MITSLFKQSTLYFFGLMGNRAVVVFLWIILARWYNPHIVGSVIFFITITEVATLLGDFGLNQWYMKHAKEDVIATFQKSVSARILTLGIALVSTGIFLTIINPFPFTVSVLLIIILLPRAALSILDGYFLVQKQTLLLVAKNILISLIMLAGLAYFGSGLDLVGLISLYSGANILSAFLFFPWYVVKTLSWKNAGRDSRTTLRQSSAYAFLLTASFVYARGDTLLLGSLAGTAVLGIYGIAYRILELISLFPSALVQNLFPIAARVGTVSKKHALTMVGIMGVAGLASAISLYIISPVIIPLIFGSEYNEATTILQIFSLVTFLFFINAPLSAIVQSSHLVNRFLPWGIGNTGINLILNLIFIPVYGMYASAWIMVLTESTGFFINISFVNMIYRNLKK